MALVGGGRNGNQRGDVTKEIKKEKDIPIGRVHCDKLGMQIARCDIEQPMAVVAMSRVCFQTRNPRLEISTVAKEGHESVS